MTSTRFARNTILGSIVIVGAVALTAHHIVEANGRTPPSAHKGVSVAKLGIVDADSMKATLGLKGHIMQLREITLAPGGQIARHSHAKRPGLVWTLEGSWVEGRPEGEKEYPDTLKQALIEDESTDHWFFNDTDKPVRVVVCDIVPAPFQ